MALLTSNTLKLNQAAATATAGLKQLGFDRAVISRPSALMSRGRIESPEVPPVSDVPPVWSAYQVASHRVGRPAHHPCLPVMPVATATTVTTDRFLASDRLPNAFANPGNPGRKHRSGSDADRRQDRLSDWGTVEVRERGTAVG